MRVSSSVLYLRSTRKEEKQYAPRGEPDLTNLRIVKEKKRDKETPLGQQVPAGLRGGRYIWHFLASAGLALADASHHTGK